MDISAEEFSHIPRHAEPHVRERISALGIGQKMQDLPEELWHESFRKYVRDESRNGGPNLRLIRLDPNKPSLTVTGYIFNKFVHPTEDRFISPREAARLQGFPDTFLFKGSRTSVQRQVGNAVPTQLAKAVAETILRHIAKHHPAGIGIRVYKNGKLPAISMFSGAGGMDIGVSTAKVCRTSFVPKAAVEIDHDCCETLRANFRGVLSVFERSIVDCETRELTECCGLEEDVLPLVFGGPPCQSFSQAGKQLATDDPRGELIFDYLRAIDQLRPMYFILENVSNLRGIRGGVLFREILSRIDGMRYHVTQCLLNAVDFGAAQRRKRLILIGVQRSFPPVEPPNPTHGHYVGMLPYKTVSDAFSGLPPPPKWP